ncbi:ATP-binding mismatch repair protein [Basidiobolus ranarum]|uniref:ATP-binding mismatch repair protein n=1 Tax=Basidiobolus ranarum TaxID=34480 RepID=A0ABR2WKS2_9FUNG
MSIKAIDKLTVHRICSGQVVLNLANAVKELIENSLDAGSSTIEIKLRDCGLDLIEIVDNGNGIEPEDYDTIALKHYTSKLRDFDELTGVSSFGFRGEALSSLCALGNVCITTATRAQAPRGNKLEFDSNGKIQKTTPCAREKGVTVQVQKLFHTLPVRFKEFKKNSKREYGKCLTLVQAYAIVSENVKFVLSNQPHKGARQIALSTKGNRTFLENLTNIFGAKIAAQLIPLEIEFPVNGTMTNIRVLGHISKPIGGAGRSSPDRQFFYINGRPCDLPKIAKVFNEVYRTCNSGQYPFVVANILIDTGCYDVNVTPDKRTIYLHNEKDLIENLKEQLDTLFQPFRSTFTTASIQSYMAISESTELNLSIKDDTIIESQTLEIDIPEVIDCQTEVNEDTLLIERDIQKDALNNASANQVPGAFFSKEIEPAAKTYLKEEFNLLSYKIQDFNIESSSNNVLHPITLNDGKRPLPKYEEEPVIEFSQPSRVISTIIKPPKRHKSSNESSTRSDSEYTSSSATKSSITLDSRSIEAEFSSNDDLALDLHIGVSSETSSSFTEELNDSPLKLNNLGFSNSLRLHFDMGRYSSLSDKSDRSDTKLDEHADELAGANLDELDSEKAELVLQRVISKNDFLNMQIIGQFNLGFIIANLRDSKRNDLFIIDQHASDEKYRFENLQKGTVIQTQKLFIPKPMELTAADELVAIEYSHILKENGFEIEYDPDKPPTKRIKLLTVPYSKKLEFGIQDLEELIHLLTENPGVSVKFSRIRKMFASRACRSAVMIGDPLTKRQMEQIVRHMAEIDQPWNCPHGRPTMRHISDLKQVPKRENRFRRRLNKGSLYQSTDS